MELKPPAPGDFVTDTADGLDEIVAEFLAQAMNVYFNRIAGYLLTPGIQASLQHTACLHASRVFHQALEQHVFTPGQVHRLTIDRNALRHGIQAHLANRDVIALHRSDATLQHTQPGQKLGHFEGFDKVVIGTAVEACHLVIEPITGGQHEYRQFLVFRSHLFQYTDAIDIRQADIENDDIRFVILDHVQGSLTGTDVIDDIALLAKGLLQALRQGQIIFNQKNLHGRILLHDHPASTGLDQS